MYGELEEVNVKQILKNLLLSMKDFDQLLIHSTDPKSYKKKV